LLPKLAKPSATDLILSPDYSMMFSVRVDKHGEFIFVCKDLISETPAFSRGISCCENWRLGHTIPIDLPDVDAESFRVYIHWVNTGKLVIEPCRCERFHEFHEQNSLVEAYIIGDFLEDRECRKHVMSGLIAKLSSWKTYFSGDLITRIWEAAHSPSSPLNKFALHWLLVKHRKGFVVKLECGPLPQEFLAEALPLTFRYDIPAIDEQCEELLRRLTNEH
jgi:hypothetical protein